MELKTLEDIKQSFAELGKLEEIQQDLKNIEGENNHLAKIEEIKRLNTNLNAIKARIVNIVD